MDSDWETTGELNPDDVFSIKESVLEQVHRAIDLIRERGLHINPSFHRAPAYYINNPVREPFVLRQDQRAEDAFVHHWDIFAKRYRDLPPSDLNSSLVNEAPGSLSSDRGEPHG